MVQDKEQLSRAAPSVLPGGAALSAEIEGSLRAWVLIDDGVVARFGAALAWASRLGAACLDVLVDGSPSAPGIIARRAACFSSAPRVWAVSGTSLDPAVPAPSVPDALDAPPSELVSLLAAHDLEVVWEHGVLRGEVLGLEVARTVGDRLEVGVGRHDRSARFEMRPSESVTAALSEAAAAVRAQRRRDALSHPANTLARGRWLRSVLVSSPGRVGLASLRPVAPPLPWFDLPEAGPAPAVGVSSSTGGPVVVVCSVGVDLDLVPTAADCRLLYGSGDAELWLVLPEGDDLPITRSLAGRLDPPARVVTVPRGWEDAGGAALDG